MEVQGRSEWLVIRRGRAIVIFERGLEAVPCTHSENSADNKMEDDAVDEILSRVVENRERLFSEQIDKGQHQRCADHVGAEVLLNMLK